MWDCVAGSGRCTLFTPANHFSTLCIWRPVVERTAIRAGKLWVCSSGNGTCKEQGACQISGWQLWLPALELLHSPCFCTDSALAGLATQPNCAARFNQQWLASCKLFSGCFLHFGSLYDMHHCVFEPSDGLGRTRPHPVVVRGLQCSRPCFFPANAAQAWYCCA